MVTAATPETDVGTLFWATLFSPVWILVLKLHGLYDNDHRRIRHSTLDELPRPDLRRGAGHARARRPAGAEPRRCARRLQRDRGRLRRAARQLRLARRAALLLAPPGRRRDRLVIGPAAARRRRRPPCRDPPRDPPAPGRIPGAAGRGRRARSRRAAPPRLGRRYLAGRPRTRGRAGDRDRAGDERARGRAHDRGVQGGRPGADLPAPALRPARARDRAEPAGRAAGARLPLLRPAALDRRAEADAWTWRSAAPCSS